MKNVVLHKTLRYSTFQSEIIQIYWEIFSVKDFFTAALNISGSLVR